MSIFLKLASGVVSCLVMSSCLGQQKKTAPQVLSDDFDKQQPFDYKQPQQLTATDTSAAWSENSERLLLTGKVLKRDGKTPAANTVLYYYQTNSEGIYQTDASQPLNMPYNKLGQTHGYIRGWVKTDAQGNYAIYTIKPGSYPGRDEPAHIHVSVNDPLMQQPYYLDDFVFDSDGLLTDKKRRAFENRGGSGVLKLKKHNGLLVGERTIILGLNIPAYPD